METVNDVLDLWSQSRVSEEHSDVVEITTQSDHTTRPVMDRLPVLHTRDVIRQSVDKDHLILLSELTDDKVFGLHRLDIKFSPRKYRRTGGYLPQIVRKKVTPLFDRTMDSASSDALDFPDDAIDKVARANSVRLDSSGILPEVRASPCPMHSKYDKKSDLMYMSNDNGGSPSNYAKKNGKVRKMVSSSSLDNALSANKEDLAVVGRMPNKTSLPGNMPSKEFVMTWLMYGSEPGSGNHFPELVKNDSAKKSRGKPVLRKGTTKDLSFGE